MTPATGHAIDRADAVARVRGSALRLRLACNMHQAERWHDDQDELLDIAHLLAARGLALDGLIRTLAHEHEQPNDTTARGPGSNAPTLSAIVADARTELQLARTQLAAPHVVSPSCRLHDATEGVVTLTRRVRCTLERTTLRAPSTPSHLARAVQQINEALLAIASGQRASALAPTMFAGATLESEIALRGRYLRAAPGN